MPNIAKQTKDLCEKFNIKPSRKFGQNFLIDESIYEQIIKVSDIDNNDEVLEVGPGLGFLTLELAKRAKKVTTIDIDQKMVEVLRYRINKLKVKNIEVINEDVLEYQYKVKNYKIVANLPYNITSIFLRKFLTAENKPKTITLLLQKEVVDRLISSPGKMSLLGLSAQLYARVKKVCDVPRNAFYPAPKVDSAVVHLELYSLAEIKDKYLKLFSKAFDVKQFEKQFFRLAKIGFAQKRKMLKNNLANGFHITNKAAEEMLSAVGLPVNIRAQELSIADWVKLIKN